jgi:hypothetical protein
MFTIEKNYTIQEFIAILLKKRFHDSPIKQQINDSDNDKLNFACPYCGDSSHDPNKKRGNFYLSTATYKCYNDGCAVWVKAEKFISHFAKKYSLPIPGVEKKTEFKPTLSSRKGSMIEFLINREIGLKLLLFDQLVERFSLLACASAPPESRIGKYIDSRKMRGLPLFEKSCYYDSREDKIYLFNLDQRSGRVLGFAIRRISEDWTGPRYDIKNYGELKKNGIVQGLDDEFIQRVNLINNYFNVLNVNFLEPVSITEGQIDAMFVRNCIATTGITKGKQLLDSLLVKSKTRVLFDSDSAGKTESVALIKKGYSVFLWAKVFDHLSKRFPKDRKLIFQIKDINDLFKYMYAKDSNLNFEQFNLFLDDYFSNSALDLLFV